MQTMGDLKVNTMKDFLLVAVHAGKNLMEAVQDMLKARTLVLAYIKCIMTVCSHLSRGCVFL